MLLGALVRFAESLELLLGPMFSEILGFALLTALAWWRGKKAITAAVSKVEAKADAANLSASNAKAEAREAKVQLAEIRGSLRPAANIPSITPPVIGTSSSQSGNFEKIDMPTMDAATPKPRPSMANPELSGEEPLPRPSALPRFDVPGKG